MSHRNPDYDSARVTAVMQSLNRLPVPSPHVDGVDISGDNAEVRISGGNGLSAVVRLRKNGERWIVLDVSPATESDAAA